MREQSGPNSDATERSVWSGSTLFATSPAILRHQQAVKHTPDSRYLGFACREQPPISKWKSGLCFHMEI